MRNQFDGEHFRVYLKIWRNMHNLSVSDVMELTGMARSTYSFYESGDRAPDLAHFSRLCQLMSVDAAEFFKTPEKVVKRGQ